MNNYYINYKNLDGDKVKESFLKFDIYVLSLYFICNELYDLIVFCIVLFCSVICSNNILLMKVFERFKKNYGGRGIKHNSSYQKKTYSTDYGFTKKGKEDVVNDIIKERLSPKIFNEKKVLKVEDVKKVQEDLKNFEKQITHPLIIKEGETENGETQLFITSTTGSQKDVFMRGKVIEVEKIGTNHKSGYRGVVKAVTEVKVSTQDLISGKVLEEPRRFKFSEEEREEMIKRSMEIINNKEIGCYNIMTGRWSKNEIKFTEYERYEEFIDRIKKGNKDFINKD